jgi:hypothetical protein
MWQEEGAEINSTHHKNLSSCLMALEQTVQKETNFVRQSGVKVRVRCRKLMKQLSLLTVISSCNIQYLSTPVFVCTDMNLK